mgnify:CR=1 FL=1
MVHTNHAAVTHFRSITWVIYAYWVMYILLTVFPQFNFLIYFTTATYAPLIINIFSTSHLFFLNFIRLYFFVLMNTHISFRFSLNLFYKLTLSSSVIPSLWLCKFSSLCCRQHWGFIGYIFCWVKQACHIAFRVRCCLFLCYLFPRYVQNAIESSINIYWKFVFLNWLILEIS